MNKLYLIATLILFSQTLLASEQLITDLKNVEIYDIPTKQLGEIKAKNIINSLQYIKAITTMKMEGNTLTWTVNKRRLSSKLSGKLPLYEGEEPELTSTIKKEDYNPYNYLYFNEKPLGQTNGSTYKFENNDTGIFLSQILSNLKIFIEVKIKEGEFLIPILSTSEIDGCGTGFFSETPKLLCVQTSNPSHNNLNIGYKDGFTNTLPPKYDYKNASLTIKTYYKNEELK